MSITPEQRQEIDQLMAEFRDKPVMDPLARAQFSRAQELARMVHGDPADGRPAWAVRSEDHSEAIDLDERVVFHYGPTVKLPNGEGEPSVVTVNLEQQVTTTATDERRDTYVNLDRCETVDVGSIRQLAAALLNAADVLDGVK